MDMIQIIEKYGLSIRQIPKETRALYDMRHHKEGNKIVYSSLDMEHINYIPFKKKRGDDSGLIFDDANQTIKRRYTEVLTVPNKAGYWMCKQVKSTSSSVQWNIKKDNLASTLEKSLQLFLTTH